MTHPCLPGGFLTPRLGMLPGSLLGTSGAAAVVTVPPAWKANGTIVSTASGTKTVAWPTHVAGDTALLVEVRCAFDSTATPTLTTPAGFALVDTFEGIFNTISTRITVWSCTATGAAMASPVIATFTGIGHRAAITTFSGCHATPVDVSSGVGAIAYDGLAMAITGDTTTHDNELVVVAAGSFRNGTGSDVGSWANAGLTAVTERYDSHAAVGGEIIALALTTGVKAAQGAYGNTTATWDGSYAVWAGITVALRPA